MRLVYNWIIASGRLPVNTPRFIISIAEVNEMKVRLNENQEIVDAIREGLERTGGYCPCRIERIEDNKCMCKEFRDQIADPEYEGYCHCYLYYKEK